MTPNADEHEQKGESFIRRLIGGRRRAGVVGVILVLRLGLGQFGPPKHNDQNEHKDGDDEIRNIKRLISRFSAAGGRVEKLRRNDGAGDPA